MLLRKTGEELKTETIRGLQDSGTITNLNPGGIARSIVEIIGSKLGEFHNTLALNMAMRYVTTAAGPYLDLLGDSMGVSRLDASQATVDRTDQNIRFYVNSGKLKDVLPAKVIPVDTQITTSDSSVVYKTTENTDFNDFDTQVYVSAISVDTGESQNVGPASLTSHDLGVSALVTNDKAIRSARDVESDESFRFRLRNSHLTLQQANATALRLAVMTIPDVSDVRVREFPGGVGTYEILIVPTTSTVTFETLRRARILIDSVRAAGVRVEVREPDYIPLEIHVKLSYNRGVSDAAQARIAQNVRVNVIDYIDDIPMGGVLVINELRQRVMQTDEGIMDMQITCLNVDRRPQLLTNVRLAEEEIFILDTDADDPVSIS